MNYTKHEFVLGRCKAQKGQIPDLLSSELIRLVEKHGRVKAAAYCLRELVKVSKKIKTYKGVNYMLEVYEDMLDNNHKKLTSIGDFRPYINKKLIQYIGLKND